MELPRIDITQLPDLEMENGVFGSTSQPDHGLGMADGEIIICMVYLYVKQQ